MANKNSDSTNNCRRIEKRNFTSQIPIFTGQLLLPAISHAINRIDMIEAFVELDKLFPHALDM